MQEEFGRVIQDLILKGCQCQPKALDSILLLQGVYNQLGLLQTDSEARQGSVSKQGDEKLLKTGVTSTKHPFPLFAFTNG